ncbi:MAG: hypothetical protein RBU30_04760 [Polyangia bacterium]|jgi:hypothetical protein|nr:hypothetical protein [Polyangia bacterium]
MSIPARSLNVAILALLLSLSTVACSDDDGPGNNSNLDAAVTPDAETQDSQVASDAAPDASEPERGLATDLTINVHDATETAVRISDLSVLPSYSGADYDFKIVQIHPAPRFDLGPGATAINAGNLTPYHGYDVAPESGYAADDPTPVIGITYQAGGTGTTGFIMSENVYVLRLADGTNAKITVLSAMGGIIHVLCYRQGDGSRNIATQPGG